MLAYLSAALSQHHLSGFGIAQLEFHHLLTRRHMAWAGPHSVHHQGRDSATAPPGPCAGPGGAPGWGSSRFAEVGRQGWRVPCLLCVEACATVRTGQVTAP